MKKFFLYPTLLLLLAQAAGAQNSSPFWSLAGNNNASTSSKLGTTNSVPLRLFTNNSERLRIDASGNVGIGTASPLNILTIKLNGSKPASSWLAGGSSLPAFLAFGENQATGFNLATAANAGGYRPVLNTRRSRGTLAAPAAVMNNDYLASFVSSGYDGSTFQNPATIDFYVDGAPSSGNVPARISFVTGSNAQNRAERLKVGSTGDFSFNSSQLFIQQSTGNIGIGTASPSNKLDVMGNINVFDTVGTAIFANSTSQYGYGVEGVSNYLGTYGYGGTFGVYGFGGSLVDTSMGISGFSRGGHGRGVYGTGYYGVYARGTLGLYATSNVGGHEAIQAYATGASNYGIYSYSGGSIGVYGSTGNSSSYAGFFGGDVYSTGSYQGSDARLKKDVTSFDKALDIINRLKPRYYQYRNDGNFAKMNLPTGRHYGFIAQDIETVLPGLVKESQFDVTRLNTAGAPEAAVNTKAEVIDFKAVNYTELIPVIVKAMQEMNADKDRQIAELQSQVNELKALIVKGGANPPAIASAGYLKQNVPNPAGDNIAISYYVPENSERSRIVVSDIKGSTLKVYTAPAGAGQVNIRKGELPAGVYNYTLYANDKKIDTKQMVIAK